MTVEFNIEADRASARLRRGVGEHTLSVGDHDATAMINGDIVALQRLALAISTEAGLKIHADGHIDGRDTLSSTLAEVASLRAVLSAVQANSIDDLTQKIALKAKELGGVTAGHTGAPIVSIRYSDSLKRWGGWAAIVEVKGPRKPGRYASGRGHSSAQAIRELAGKVGLL